MTILVSGLLAGRELRAFLASSFLLAGLLIAGSAAIFPVMLYSTLLPQGSLTANSVAAPTNLCSSPPPGGR